MSGTWSTSELLDAGLCLPGMVGWSEIVLSHESRANYMGARRQDRNPITGGGEQGNPLNEILELRGLNTETH